MSDVFRTHDLQLASVLLHEKFPLVMLDRSQQRAVFVFEHTKALADTVSAYWRGDLCCPALTLLASFKRAKHILFDYQNVGPVPAA